MGDCIFFAVNIKNLFPKDIGIDQQGIHIKGGVPIDGSQAILNR